MSDRKNDWAFEIGWSLRLALLLMFVAFIIDKCVEGV